MVPIPPSIVALEDQETRAALTRYWWKALGWLAAGLILLYPMILAIGALEEPAHAHSGNYEHFTGYLIGAFLVTFGAATVMLRRAIRWQKLLADQPWRAFQARYLPSIPGRAEGGLVLTPVDQPAVPQVVLRISVARWRRERLSDEPTLWVCGDPSAEVVVTSPMSHSLYSGQPPRGYIGRKWRRAHKAELVYLGIELPEVVNRRSLAAAILLSTISALLLTGIFGLVIEIAKGKPTGTSFWITAAVMCLLATWMVRLAVAWWSKAE
jgi:hypothetical protein